MPRLRWSLVLKKVLAVRTRETSAPRIFHMSNDAPMTLRDVARAALDANPGVSGRQLERLAKKRGLTISYTTINHLAAGTYKSRPSRKTLEALAALADVEREVVYRAAGEPLPRTPLREDLPPDSDILTGPQRRIVVELIRSFAQTNREIESLRDAARREVMGNAEHPAAIKKPEAGPADQPAAPGLTVVPEDIAAHEEEHPIESEQDHPDSP